MTDKREHAGAPQASSSKGDAPSASSPEAIRRQAEARLLNKVAPLLENLESLSLEQTREMLHELQVHQIELEMQNEELRDAQVALDLERARYFDLYDLAPVGYCTLSETGLIKQANLTVASLLGTTRSELLKQRWTQFIHKEDADLYYLQRKKLLESGEPQSCELRMIKKDGTSFWGHWAATVSFIAGSQLELRVVLSDITELKQAEAALRLSNDRFELAVKASQAVLWQQDLDLRFTWLHNPAPGIDSSDAVGKREADLLERAEDVAVIEGLKREVIRSGVGLRAEFFPQIQGVVHCFELLMEPLRDAGGLITGLTGAASDITERKRIEQELIKINAVADKANRAKSEFLSSMSHELRTPLNAILGFAQLIEAGSPPPTPSQKRNVDYILKAGWYLLALVDEILDLAVVESGAFSLSMEAVSLDEVMRECQAMVEQQAQTRGISMSFPHFAAPCHINADRNRLKQVLSNLLSNAIKYNRPEGAVMVDCAPSTAGRIRITVADTGDGLSADKLAQLFQSFNRLGKEAGTVQGTGIGLVVSKRIVEMMGGEIGVQSTVGKGSVFWFELNLTTDPTPVAVTAQALAVTSVPGHIDMPLRTLLYVEDNPANMALVEAIISNRPDIRLLTATDGDIGVQIARTELPDVILMDIHLPGISGIDAMKILAEDPATARIPVLALSANAIASDIEYGLGAGFFRYLTKPIKIDEFLHAMDIALQFSLASASSTPQKEQP